MLALLRWKASQFVSLLIHNRLRQLSLAQCATMIYFQLIMAPPMMLLIMLSMNTTASSLPTT